MGLPFGSAHPTGRGFRRAIRWTELVLELQVSRSCPEIGINVVRQMRTYAGNMRPNRGRQGNCMHGALYRVCRVHPIREERRR